MFQAASKLLFYTRFFIKIVFIRIRRAKIAEKQEFLVELFKFIICHSKFLLPIIKGKNECCIWLKKFNYLVKIKYVLQNIHNEHCALFNALFVALSVCVFYLVICCIFPESFPCIQIKLELFSFKIVSAVENKELLSHFRVYKKMWQVHKRRMDNNRRTILYCYPTLTPS